MSEFKFLVAIGRTKKRKQGEVDKREPKRQSLTGCPTSDESMVCMASNSDARMVSSSKTPSLSPTVNVGCEFVSRQVPTILVEYYRDVNTLNSDVPNDDVETPRVDRVLAAQQVVSLLILVQKGTDIKNLALAEECQCLFDTHAHVREVLAPQGDMQYWAGALVHPPDNNIFKKKLAYFIMTLLKQRRALAS